jgi:hypothetical protein
VFLLLAVNGYSYFYQPFKLISQSVTKVFPRLKHSSFLQMSVKEAPPKIDTFSGGMFTNSSPDTKRVVPQNMQGKTKFKIVYVVLESQYQSALTKACNSINAGKEGVAVEAVGYLLEELRNADVFEQFKADVADSNIFIGSLIFVQELADKVFKHFL